jgi:hypothetical protein
VIYLAQDRLARESSPIWSVIHFAVDLGSDDDLVSLRKVRERASKNLLTCPNGIDIGGIEEVDPQVKGFFDDRSALLFVEHPLMNPTAGVPEPHAAKTDARHIHAGISKLRVFHTLVLSLFFVSQLKTRP